MSGYKLNPHGARVVPASNSSNNSSKSSPSLSSAVRSGASSSSVTPPSSVTPSPAVSPSPFGGLFSGLSSMGAGFVDGLKNAGKAFFNMFKELADGSLKIEPLDIYTAIGDLIKSFFNAIFECVKPAASALGITDPSIVGDSVGTSTASPSRVSATGAGAGKSSLHPLHMPGDSKREVERSSIAEHSSSSAEHASKGSKSRKSSKTSKGLGFSPGSTDAGLQGASARSKVAGSAFDYDCHDELYDPDTEELTSQRVTRR